MKFVAVTACPTGIAHSQMAAEGLEQTADSLGHEVRVEIQGAMGAEDELGEAEIADADAVIIAADTSVSRDRFTDKPVLKVPVARAINETEQLFTEAEKAAADDDTAADTETAADEANETTGTPARSTGNDGASAQSGLLARLKGLFS